MPLWIVVVVSICVTSRGSHFTMVTANPSGILIHNQQVDLSEDPMAVDNSGATGSYHNRHPVIGVLSQRVYGENRSYLYESYVKFIEQSGALVVPIRVDEPDSYYTTLFRKLNGVIFPGGGVGLITSGYAKAAQHFFEMSKQAHDKGDTFPILAICLGIQELTALVTKKNLLVKCNGEDFSLPLQFTKEARGSRLFKDMPDVLYNGLADWNLTYNHHQYCMSTKVFRESKLLSEFYNVLSTNVAKDGTEFVSTMEAFKYPFYGTQWHPEKNIYLWSDAHVNHSALAVKVTQYISNFFVDQARNSSHRFDDLDDLARAVISNYNPKFNGAPSFHSVYYFDIPSGTVNAETEDSFWVWPRYGQHLIDVRTSRFMNFLMLLLVVVGLFMVLSLVLRQRPGQLTDIRTDINYNHLSS